jgi:ActR/RegA family two-component response regulator
MDTITRLLLVEPDDRARRTLEAAASRIVEVECHRAFETARASLRDAPFAFVVTNLRIDAHNGLHLVYLSSSASQPPRAIVYSEERELWAARESHHAGAFYEVARCLPVTISAYLTARLPLRDRRDPLLTDRRQLFRSGRRCWDKHIEQLNA